MPPNSKKGTPKGKESRLPEINTETLCDEGWKCDVAFLYEGDNDGSNFISLLQQIPAKQVTGNLKIVNKIDLMKDVKKVGSKGKSSGKSTKSSEVVELSDEQKIMQCVIDNKNIPGAPLANIIKKSLINLKVEDINDRKKQLAAFEDAKKKGKKPQDSKKGKSPKEVTNETVPATEFVDKPPLSILLYGFNEHDLPFELLKVDVPLRCVVKLVGSVIKDDFEEKKVDDGVLSVAGSEKFVINWYKFWRDFNELLNIPINCDLSNDLAVINYILPKQLIDNNVNIKDKKNIVVNKLNDLIVYVQAVLDMHKIYFNNIIMYEIPQATSIPELPDLYNTLVEMVPLESTSILVVLYALIEQVCYWNDNDAELHSEYLSDINCSCKDDFESIPLMRKCDPALIRHNDENFLRTFHLNIPEIDFSKIIVRFLTQQYFFQPLLQTRKQDKIQKYFYEFHLQRLWKLSYREIHLNLFYIYLHLYILYKMKMHYKINLKQKEVYNDSITYIDPMIYTEAINIEFLSDWINESDINNSAEITDQISDSNENCKTNYNTSSSSQEVIDENSNSPTDKQVNSNKEYESSKSITANRSRSLQILRKFLYCPEIYCLCQPETFPKLTSTIKSFSSYSFIEEMPTDSLLQVIQESLFNYSEVQYIHYYPSNKILLWFHNIKDSIFVSRRTGRLSTRLGFRDYYNGLIQPIEEQLQNDITTLNKEKESNNEIQLNTNNEIVYNIGKKKIEFEENIEKFHSEDGTSVTVKSNNSYGSFHYINICINKIDAILNINIDQMALSENNNDNYLQTDLPKECIKMFVDFPNDTLLNVKVEQVTKNETLLTVTDTVTHFRYSNLVITLPSGLIIEAVENKYENNEIYIKQSYSAMGPNCDKIWDEQCRCITKSGNLIIMRCDGTVDVLHCNTTVTKLTKIVVEESKEEVKEVVKVEEEKKETAKKESPKKETAKKESPKKETAKKESPKKGKKDKNEKVDMNKVEVKAEQEKKPKLEYKVKECLVDSWSGIGYYYRNEKCENIINNVILRTIFDPFKRLYIDRNDGVKCLYTDNSCLLSTFIDDTLMTSYLFEEPTCINLDLINSANTEENLKKSENESNPTANVFDESYVAYKVGYIVEHPNYATVEYSPVDNSIRIQIPGEITVIIHSIESDGSFNFSVKVDKKSCIDFKKECIEFQSNILKKSKCVNITSIEPFSENIQTSEDMYFCKTTDTFNKLFLVNKFGEIKLTSVQENKTSSSFCVDKEYYYDKEIPEQVHERYFVVSEQFTGYEILNENDIELLEKDLENRYKNMQTTKNPTNNRINSRSRQYLIYKTRSDEFMLQGQLKFSDLLPTIFQRADLSPPWKSDESPWFFVRSGRKTTFRPFSLNGVPKHNDNYILAVVIRIIQKVANTSDFNGLEVIINCLDKYINENDKLCNKYRQQGFTDYDIDLRMKENHELVSDIRKFPLWNIIRKECHLCKMSFGCPMRPVDKLNNVEVNNTR